MTSPIRPARRSTRRPRLLTQFGRPEDGHWDPSNPNVFYFVTTGATVCGVPIPTRLWRMEFTDVEHPELGGTIKVVVEGGLTTSPTRPSR